MISLGVDPGTSNYAYAFTNCRLRNGNLRVNVKSAGQLHWTITNLTNSAQKPPKSKRKKRIPIAEQMIPPYHLQLDKFTTDWTNQFDKFEPKLFACERFQTRGIKGKSVECISIMNGVLSFIARNRNIEPVNITAAQWKNQVNKFYSLDDLYEELKPLPPHIVDAAFISVYNALRHFDLSWSLSVIEELADELERLVYTK